MRLFYRILGVALVALMLLHPAMVVVSAATSPPAALGGRPLPYIHWALWSPEAYKRLVDRGVFAAFEGVAKKLAEELHMPRHEPVYRILILAPPKLDPVKLAKMLRGRVAALGWIARLPAFTLVYALATPSDIRKLAETPGLLAVLPDLSLDYARPRPLAEAMVGGVYRAKPMQSSGIATVLPYHETVYITRAADVWAEGDEGQLAKIAIIDTGVDYATPALGLGAIARDSSGKPLILEDTEGLLLFSVTAQVVNSTHIWVNVSKVYAWFNDLLGAYVAKTTNLTYIGVRTLSVRMPSYWRIPPQVYEAYEAGGAPPKFGILVETVLVPLGGELIPLVFTVPALAVDLNHDGLYDAIYFDTSTAYNMTMYALGLTNSYGGDYSFADEKPVYYGNEIIARDFNGDGYPDFSVGTLAGYYYDAYGIALLQYTGALEKIMEQQSYYYPRYAYDWPTFDYVGLILPGFDVWHGSYAAIHYDFYSHGTFCATTAAGRPVPGYTGYGYEGYTLVAGEAPEAKIASADALFAGDVAAALFFFSGFDQTYVDASGNLVPVTGAGLLRLLSELGYGAITWVYTGRHQVDITSNSWGVSAWALWGFASGLGPLEQVIDYTSSTSGTAHFVAAGNGGPGWGTVTVPAAAATAVTVGAATEFTYRPLFGYLIGGNREVISWSDRGPAESGISKPDVVAIGSFAFAVGRIWESLTYNTLNGNPVYLVQLFSGTSEATPMAAGVAALVVTAYKQMHGGRRMPAWMLKTILMNAASDTGFDPFSQGAGFVDAYTAVEYLKRGILVYNPYFKRQAAALGIEIPGEWYEPKVVALTAPGGIVRFAVVAKNVGIYPSTQIVEFIRVYRAVYHATVDLSKVNGFTPYPILYLDPAKLAGYHLIQIRVYYPYWYFAEGRSGAPLPNGAKILYSGIELWYWVDLNHDGRIEPGETARITYDIRGGNYLTIQVGYLAKQIEEIRKLNLKYLGIDISRYPGRLVLVLRLYHRYTSGQLPLTIVVEGYDAARAGFAYSYHIGATTYIIGALRAPPTPGTYEYYLVITPRFTGKPILVPITINVYKVIGLSKTTLAGRPTRLLYENYLLRGAQDWTWRYESGDWRVFFVKVTDPNIGMLVVDLYYPLAPLPDYTSNLDLQVYGPVTVYLLDLSGWNGAANSGIPVIASYVMNGVELAGELTLNYLYWWDYPAPGHSQVVVPVEKPGIYRVVVRNIQYSGVSLEEPFTVTITPVIRYVYNSFVRRGATVTIPLLTYAASYPGLRITSIEWYGDFILKTGSSMTYYIRNPELVTPYDTYTRTIGAYTVAYATLKVSTSVPSGAQILLPLHVVLNKDVFSIGELAYGTPQYSYNINDFYDFATLIAR